MKALVDAKGILKRELLRKEKEKTEIEGQIYRLKKALSGLEYGEGLVRVRRKAVVKGKGKDLVLPTKRKGNHTTTVLLPGDPLKAAKTEH